MTTIDHGFQAPTVIISGPEKAPLVVLLHGRGADARDIIGLAEHLPHHLAYAAVRAPIAEGGGYAWFANRGIGRPVAESLEATMDWFRDWLAVEAVPGRPVFLVGFSGGAAFAGGLLLADPARWAGTAILNGTLPFDAGVPTFAGRLSGAPVFLSHGLADTVIPLDLQARTWRYVTGESGATATARHDPAGHQLTAEGVAALSVWLAQLAPAPAKEPT
jgi:phospholipase/carboxylesterase